MVTVRSYRVEFLGGLTPEKMQAFLGLLHSVSIKKIEEQRFLYVEIPFMGSPAEETEELIFSSRVLKKCDAMLVPWGEKVFK